MYSLEQVGNLVVQIGFWRSVAIIIAIGVAARAASIFESVRKGLKDFQDFSLKRKTIDFQILKYTERNRIEIERRKAQIAVKRERKETR